MVALWMDLSGVDTQGLISNDCQWSCFVHVVNGDSKIGTEKKWLVPAFTKVQYPPLCPKTELESVDHIPFLSNRPYYLTA